MFFSKTCIGEVQNIGFARLPELDSAVALFEVKATRKPAILQNFVQGALGPSSAAGQWTIGFRTLPLVGPKLILDIRRKKEIIGIEIDLAKYLKAVIGIIETGWLALRLEGSEKIRDIVTLEVAEQADHMRQELYPGLLQDMIKKIAKDRGVHIPDIAEKMNEIHTTYLVKWQEWTRRDDDDIYV